MSLVKATSSAALGAFACGTLGTSVAASSRTQEPAFSTATSEVSYWRTEALKRVQISEAELATWGTRCMKLNNDWCLKGVGGN
jgi:hypothetical protein